MNSIKLVKKKGMKMSNKIKHTPGPWTVIDDRDKRFGDGKLYINAYGTNVEICRIISRCFHSKEWYDESTANANLIAAAPELFEACKLALSVMMRDGIFGKEANILMKALSKAER